MARTDSPAPLSLRRSSVDDHVVPAGLIVERQHRNDATKYIVCTCSTDGQNNARMLARFVPPLAAAVFEVDAVMSDRDACLYRGPFPMPCVGPADMSLVEKSQGDANALRNVALPRQSKLGRGMSNRFFRARTASASACGRHSIGFASDVSHEGTSPVHATGGNQKLSRTCQGAGVPISTGIWFSSPAGCSAIVAWLR